MSALSHGKRAAISLALRRAYAEKHELRSLPQEHISADLVDEVLGSESQLKAVNQDDGFADLPSWVSTPTSGRILAGLRYAQLAGDVVVIYGGAGLGKSHSLRHYQALSSNVVRVEMSPATGAILPCMEEIAQAIGLTDYVRSASYLHRIICTRLKGTKGLLIIDEAQDLGVHALDQLRCIHDRAKIGLALVGNERVYARMAGNNRAAYLDRLYSRIGKRIHLKNSTEADADVLIAAWGITDGFSRARLRAIALKPGALRVLNKTMRLATTYAQAEGRPVCGDDIDAAWQDLGGLD